MFLIARQNRYLRRFTAAEAVAPDSAKPLSVVWFLIASWLIWRSERQAEVAGKHNPDAEPGAAVT
jgi:hypothetical protein